MASADGSGEIRESGFAQMKSASWGRGGGGVQSGAQLPTGPSCLLDCGVLPLQQANEAEEGLVLLLRTPHLIHLQHVIINDVINYLWMKLCPKW